MVRKLPDGADGLGTFGGLWEFIEEEFSIEGMHELGSNTIEGNVFSQQIVEKPASSQHLSLILK